MQLLLQWTSTKYILFVCIRSFSFPACNVHAPYSNMRSFRLFLHSFTLSHKQHDLQKRLLNIKYVFWFSLQLLSETFPILRRTERYMIKMYIGLHVKCRCYSCPIVTLRLLMSYIYGAPILDVSRSHTTTHHSR